MGGVGQQAGGGQQAGQLRAGDQHVSTGLHRGISFGANHKWGKGIHYFTPPASHCAMTLASSAGRVCAGIGIGPQSPAPPAWICFVR